MPEKKDGIISLDEFRKARENKKITEEEKTMGQLTEDEEKYLTAYDYASAEGITDEEERIKELKRRAAQNKENWNDLEWRKNHIKGAGLELGIAWIEENVGRDKVGKILELTEDMDEIKIKEVIDAFGRFDTKYLATRIEEASLDEIQENPQFYRAALEEILSAYGMTIEDISSS